MREIKLDELIIDYDIYPRAQIDTTHANYMAEAERGGATLPAMVVCKKTHRIVDGVHRHKVYMMRYGPQHVVEVIEKTYKNEQELFLDAMRLNAGHGRSLSRFDRVHCMILAEKLSLTEEAAAAALSMPLQIYKQLRVERVAETELTPAIPLKQTIKHMHGRVLTPEQAKANEELSGMNQVFYVNQLITLIENDLLDLGNERLIQRLQHLKGLLRRVKAAA